MRRALFAAALATVSGHMAAVAGDCDGGCGDCGGCEIYKTSRIKCFNGTTVWDTCKKSCGTCDVNLRNRTLTDGQPMTGKLTGPAGQTFSFAAVENQSYTIRVSVVPGQANNLHDSVVYLFNTMECARDGTGNGCQPIKYNDDAKEHKKPGPEHGESQTDRRRDFGSLIAWTCRQNDTYYVRVESADTNYGYFMVELRVVDHIDDCNDGQQSAGEEGVDCGGICTPCTIPLIFTFSESPDMSTDNDNNGVPDKLQTLSKDVEQTLMPKFTVNFKLLVDTMPSGGVRVGGFVSSPPGMSTFIDKDQVVDSITSGLTCSGAACNVCSGEGGCTLKTDFPYLTDVSRGELCVSDSGGVHACDFGVCVHDSGPPSVLCACDTGYDYRGQSCAKHQHAPPPPPSTDDVAPFWRAGTYIGAICFVLAVCALVLVQKHYKTERRKYNQSVFEMLQAPESYAGPEVGFVRMDDSNARLPPPSPGTDRADSGYMPDNSFVTGGF
jgi:hypothetical protein